MKQRGLRAAALLALCWSLNAAGQAPAAAPDTLPGPQVGDVAPLFSATDQEGRPWSLAEALGEREYMVVYFYPGAMTGGCTKQACAFRDRGADLDMEVVGVSGDTPAGLKLFQEANALNFTLLSDPDGKVAGLFGVPVNRQHRALNRTVNGREVTLEREVTAARWTFVLDRAGKIIYRDTAVQAADDLNAVTAFLRSRGK